MNNVKIFALPAGLVLALALLAFAGSASASVLYKGLNKVTAGTGFQAPLKTGSTMVFEETTTHKVVDSCTGSLLEGKIAKAGGATEAVEGTVENLAWTCNVTTKTDKGGTLEFQWLEGTPNGTAFLKETLITINIGLTTCLYGVGGGAGVELGFFTGSLTGDANIAAYTVVYEQEPKKIACPDDLVWNGTYVFSTPTPLHLTKE